MIKTVETYSISRMVYLLVFAITHFVQDWIEIGLSFAGL
jgi:hypothetical protein